MAREERLTSTFVNSGWPREQRTSALEADVLPLNYARERPGTLAGAVRPASAGIAGTMRENLAMAYLPQRDPTEVIGRRISAFLIDTLLVSGVSVAIFAALKTHSYTNAPTGACQQLRDNGYSSPCVQLGAHVYTWGGGRFALALLLSVLASLVNHVLLQGTTGATLGKMMLGLRVVDGSGRVCGVGRAIVRWLFLIVDQFFCFLVGLITMLVTRPHRRVGDMVAGTYVVSTADVGRPVVPQAAMPPYAYAGQGAWTPPAPGVPAWGTPPPPPQRLPAHPVLSLSPMCSPLITSTSRSDTCIAGASYRATQTAPSARSTTPRGRNCARLWCWPRGGGYSARRRGTSATYRPARPSTATWRPHTLAA